MAARLDGAGLTQIARQVLWPLSRRALLIAACIGFILSFGELPVTLFCAPPGVATLPTRLYTIMANSPTKVVASICLILIGTSFAAVLLAFMASQRMLSAKTAYQFRSR